MIFDRTESAQIDPASLAEYLHLIAGETLALPQGFSTWGAFGNQNSWIYEPLPDYRTCETAFADELKTAGGMLLAHLGAKDAPQRPLNSLITGPPGSGKTFLAKKLFKYLEEHSATGAEGHWKKELLYLEFNVADFTGPAGLTAMFDQIRRQGKNRRTLVFIDEFDVRIGGTSVIRHLINPIYSARYATAAAAEEGLGRVAFVFSGSYLRNKHVIKVLQHETARFDLPRVLADLAAEYQGSDFRRATQAGFLLNCIIASRAGHEGAESDVFRYLSGLDKLEDFLSRINGFVVEIPDVSDPLNSTTQSLAVVQQFVPDEIQAVASDFARGSRPVIESPELDGVRARVLRPRNQAVADRMRDAILAYEKIARGRRIRTFDKPWMPVLVYKWMLLAERLVRLLHFVRAQFGAIDVTIDRNILHYLVTVPLVFGSRSLEFLVSQLELSPTDRRLSLSEERRMGSGFTRHAQGQVFGTPARAWDQFCRTNQIDAANVPGDGGIRLRLSAL